MYGKKRKKKRNKETTNYVTRWDQLPEVWVSFEEPKRKYMKSPPLSKKSIYVRVEEKQKGKNRWPMAKYVAWPVYGYIKEFVDIGEKKEELEETITTSSPELRYGWGVVVMLGFRDFKIGYASFRHFASLPEIHRQLPYRDPSSLLQKLPFRPRSYYCYYSYQDARIRLGGYDRRIQQRSP